MKSRVFLMLTTAGLYTAAMRNVAVLAPLLAVCVLTGCHKREEDVVGKWKGSVALPANTPNAAQVQALLSNISGEFKEDHKCTLTIVAPMEGTWSLNGDTVNVKIATISGMSIDQVKGMMKNMGGATASASSQLDKPMELTLSSDGKSMTQKGGSPATGTMSQMSPGADKGSMTWTKQAS